MLSQSQLEAIFTLLDDTDEEVAKIVEDRLLAEGTEIVSTLENFWTSNRNPELAYRIETIISHIHQNQSERDFQNWFNEGGINLLEACIMVCKIHYPGMNTDVIHKYLDKVRLDAWMAMYSAQNPMDKVHILNHILFERQGLKGNTDNYHSPDNSFLHRLIESRTGNPINLCNLYAILAQRLGMPVFGVNLPQHFVLAYCDDSGMDTQVQYNSKPFLNRSNYGKVLFYINPFSKGQVFLENNLDEFLKAIKVEPLKEFYEPCNNIEIVKRMLRNLHFSYSEIQNKDKMIEVDKYMHILEKDSNADEE